MGLIYLYLDHTHVLEPAPDRFLVEAISDYVPAYARIAEAIHAGQPLTVVVRHQTCAAWLQAAQEKYGPERIAVETISHRGRLAELWGVKVPDWVTDQAIARSNLLDIPLRAQPGQSFENVVREALYSPFLAYNHLPLTYLADLLNSYDSERWARADQRPCGRPAYPTTTTSAASTSQSPRT